MKVTDVFGFCQPQGTKRWVVRC